MPFFEDLSVFINSDTPGYKRLTIDYVPIDGIFDDDYQESNFTESSNPVFMVKTADIPDVKQGSMAEDSANKLWEVIGVQNDGTGMTKLELRVKWYE